MHLEGVDAVAAPDRFSGQGSINDGSTIAQDAPQEGQVKEERSNTNLLKRHQSYYISHPFEELVDILRLILLVYRLVCNAISE